MNHSALGCASSALLEWFDAHKRALPWREDPTPYSIWTAEIMLQQTVKYTKFAERLHPRVYSVEGEVSEPSDEYRWVELSELVEYPFPTAYRRIINDWMKSTPYDSTVSAPPSTVSD